MKDKMVLSVIGMIYRDFLREVVVKYVAETDNPWDDRLVVMLDALLGYRPTTPPARG